MFQAPALRETLFCIFFIAYVHRPSEGGGDTSPMIHYTCDCCKRPLDPETDLRYVVKMEVYASLDTSDEGLSGDEDHLQEIQDILERMEDAEDDRLGDDVFQQFRFDLCSTCRTKFSKNPLSISKVSHFDFSKN